MKHKLKYVLFSTVLATSLLAGCGGEPAASNPQAEIDTATSQEVMRFDQYFLPKEDAIEKMGLIQQPETAISIGWPHAMLAIESGIHVTGIPKNDHIPEEYLATIEHITDESGEIDWVKIKSLTPSVILTDAASLDKYQAELANLNVPTYTPELLSYENVLQTMGLLASAFETEDHARTTMTAYDQRIQDMRSLAQGKESKTVALVRITADGTFLYADGNYTADLLRLVNVPNAANALDMAPTNENNGMVPIELADLAKANPQAIAVMVTTAKDLRDKAFEAFMSQLEAEEYQSMAAIQNGKVERVDHHPFVVAGTLAINAMETAYTLSYE